MEQKTCIIFCRCGAGFQDVQFDEISEGLKKLDAHIYELHDLCAFSVHQKERLIALTGKYPKIIAVACYPRAVKNLLRQGGIDSSGIEVLNFKELSPQQIHASLKNEYSVREGIAEYQVQHAGLDVPAWFPVIDDSLCTLCGKCARFCLFGVYAFDRKSLKVVNPLSCKNRCPACGRTCPTSAIMFPRLDEKTSLAGAEPGKTGSKPDDNGLLVMLNDRNRERKNIFRQGVMQQAEEERRKALADLKETFVRKN